MREGQVYLCYQRDMIYIYIYIYIYILKFIRRHETSVRRQASMLLNIYIYIYIYIYDMAVNNPRCRYTIKPYQPTKLYMFSSGFFLCSPSFSIIFLIFFRSFFHSIIFFLLLSLLLFNYLFFHYFFKIVFPFFFSLSSINAFLYFSFFNRF